MKGDVTIGDGEPGERKSRRSSFVGIFAAAAAALVLVGALLVMLRRSQFQALAKETEAQSIPTVAVIHPTPRDGAEELVLPGTLQAYIESPIYARTNGYLKRWYHDIGSRVNQGDLLADIDTPEVDQQLLAARADLVTAQASENLARVTAARYSGLLKSDSVSRQEVDNAVGDLAAKRATMHSLEANVRRLEQLKSFQHVYSPFGGVIIRRNVDPGTLINAGNGGASQVLFVLVQIDVMRLYVSVPEAFAPFVHKGLPTYLTVTQYPGETFRGNVVRTAGAIDASTHALLTEVDVPNDFGKLLPGGYAQVHLNVKVEHERLQVPVNALLFRSEGLRAVVVDGNHRVRLQALAIGRDYGTSLEVLTGLKADDLIVLNPPDGIEVGQEVHVREVRNPLAQTSSEKLVRVREDGATPAPERSP
ncbi:MAG TPA: efflux RND transporter periplasmic adaptor subunit [Anaeromyxobacteraceae bacterium]|nr:efflux RND transporter periplasmic adaptor subunit [Anaeromyxobacteraceae bacterium]